MNNLFLFFEILGFSAYFIILIKILYQKDKIRLFEFFSATVFGFILEVGNIYLAHSYNYSENFTIQLFNVPLTVGCAWAIIIYSVMLLSDQYNISWKIRPFFDALMALILDLAIDPIAIRLGFWHWSIPYNQEWYGVPYENLFGWFMVVLSFSFLMRFIRILDKKKISTYLIKIFSPIIAYLILLSGLFVFSAFVISPYQINSWHLLLEFNYFPDFNVMYNPQVQLWKLIFLMIIIIESANIVVWAIIKNHNREKYNFDFLSFFVLSIVYLFFISAIFISGMFSEIPILFYLALLMFLIHLFFYFLPFFYSRNRSFTRRIKKLFF